MRYKFMNFFCGGGGSFFFPIAKKKFTITIIILCEIQPWILEYVLSSSIIGQLSSVHFTPCVCMYVCFFWLDFLTISGLWLFFWLGSLGIIKNETKKNKYCIHFLCVVKKNAKLIFAFFKC